MYRLISWAGNEGAAPDKWSNGGLAVTQSVTTHKEREQHARRTAARGTWTWNERAWFCAKTVLLGKAWKSDVHFGMVPFDES